MADSKKSIFEENFQKALEILRSCQIKEGLSTCYICQKVLVCEIRDEYVKKSYERMSQGSGGEFEF